MHTAQGPARSPSRQPRLDDSRFTRKSAKHEAESMQLSCWCDHVEISRRHQSIARNCSLVTTTVELLAGPASVSIFLLVLLRLRMRRGPGIAALDRSLHSSTAFSSLGADLTASQLAELRQQLELFSTSLRHFSSQHRHEIRKNAQFRHAFQKMCYSIGVDPLSSSTRSSGGLAGLWSDMLGLGDWQYELGVQIIDVCVSTRDVNGGVISMDDLITRVTRLRTGSTSTSTAKGKADKDASSEITQDDIVRSIKMLAPLGCGYEVFSLGNGGQKMVRSVPRELDTDTMVVLGMLLSSSSSTATVAAAAGRAAELPFLTEDTLVTRQKARGWTRDRARAVLENMALREGMLWIDEQAFPPRYYSLATLATG